MNLLNYFNMMNQITVSHASELFQLYEFHGKHLLYEEEHTQLLKKLEDISLLQSASSMAGLDGIPVTEARLRSLVAGKAAPRTDEERAVLRYRDVLVLVRDDASSVSVSPGVLLQLHGELFAGEGSGQAGAWGSGDSAHADWLWGGKPPAPLRGVPGSDAVGEPVAAGDVASGMRALCEAYRQALKSGASSPLVDAALFLAGYVCLSPFAVGVGRMFFPLATLLLCKGGFRTVACVSLEKAVEENAYGCGDALVSAARSLRADPDDVDPFVSAFFGLVSACCEDLDERMRRPGKAKSYEAQVRVFLGQASRPVTKREVMDAVPGMSRATAERILQRMQRQRELERVGAARATRYRLR